MRADCETIVLQHARDHWLGSKAAEPDVDSPEMVAAFDAAEAEGLIEDSVRFIGAVQLTDAGRARLAELDRAAWKAAQAARWAMSAR